MGSEANIRSKTGKLPVQLYRTFFKVSIAAAIYAVYLIFIGGGDIKSSSLAVAISIFGAVGYEIVYFLYKSGSEAAKSKEENVKIKQLKVIIRFFGYLAGISLLLVSAVMISRGGYPYVILLALGLALCQQLHNNSYLSSHLSTFFESCVIASAVITLDLMLHLVQIGDVPPFSWLFGLAALILSELFAEFFFHIYNCKKHGSRDEKTAPVKGKAWKRYLVKRVLIIDRITELARDLMLIFALFSVFGILIAVGSVNTEMLEIAIAVVPVVFSVASPIIDSHKESAERAFDKYDPRISPSELREVLCNTFSEGALSVKALKYVTEEMTAKKGFKRQNGEDYFVHPIAVAMLLLENTDADDEVIAAALLHDCVEDIDGCTLELIEGEYGKTVASYVDAVTKKEGVDYRRKENMQAYLDSIAAVPNAALIKLADRINNVNTLENCPEAKKIKVYRETRMYYPRFLAKVAEKDKVNKYFYEFAEKCFEENKY